MTKHAAIWVQSCSAESDAALWRTYQDSVRKHARKVVRPEFSVEFHGLSRTYPGIDHVDSAIQLASLEVVRNAIHVEQQGYAAFAFISTNDAGNREVRELTDLPVAFVTESAVHTAAQLGGRFAFLTHNAGSLEKMAEITARLGLAGRMVEGASVGLTYNDFAGMYRDPAPYIARAERAAQAAIAHGASMLIPAGGPFNMFLLDHGVRQIAGVPVLDIMAMVLKEAEKMIDLRALGMAPRGASLTTPEQKERLRALYCGER